MLDDDLIEDEVDDNGAMMIRMGERAKSGRYPGLILKCVAPKGPTMTIPWSRILPNDEDYCGILEGNTSTCVKLKSFANPFASFYHQKVIIWNISLNQPPIFSCR